MKAVGLRSVGWSASSSAIPGAMSRRPVPLRKILWLERIYNKKEQIYFVYAPGFLGG